MAISKILRIVLPALLVVAAAAGGGALFGSLWGKGEEGAPAPEPAARPGQTVGAFVRENALPDAVARRLFGPDVSARMGEALQDPERDAVRARAALALYRENQAKNWTKIAVKFAAWVAFLLVVFRLLRSGRVKAPVRKGLLAAAVLVFGVVLGSDPSPMGTVKDAVVLMGREGVLFLPRLAAFGAFLLAVVAANKFVCSWGCQLGTLQDLLFRLNRDVRDRRGLWRQFKPSFRWTQGVRVLFFAALVAAAFAWGFDLVEPIDPFKVFHPAVLGAASVAAVAVLLAASLFVYRPWCHFFCPFGLVGWIGEKASIFRIRVDYDRCIACRACERACPSTVMGAILKRDRVVPDCFSCGTCMETCPTGSISFGAGRRARPPEGKFERAPGRGPAGEAEPERSA